MSYLAVTKNIKEAALKTSGSELVYIFFFFEIIVAELLFTKNLLQEILGLSCFKIQLCKKKQQFVFGNKSYFLNFIVFRKLNLVFYSNRQRYSMSNIWI